MSVTEKLLSGKATVTMEPLKRGEDNYTVVLKIDGEYYGEFPTYGAASDHLQMLFEE